ncbi:outer membrane protein, OmpA/MotB family [Candidatus Koribacter versatilis Ellin345]|uniref:Outer membrane protein, OmpA/MotB family n=1 Tax=Koribacter versatilis (strain Ellin345) TaxID=204669 RepID=Q1IV24_KORVE|nr:OmpA family protein [Candidatus Koribacter versatilis]ABF39276.1 outer membrane protein, OmpA/MotB family [Candidatus Koribacter versatilis Ellin345]
MKSHFLIALPLAATLALPALAQNTASTPSDNQKPAATAPAAQDSSSQAAQNNNGVTPAQEQGMAAHQPLQPDTHEGFWGHLNPFARKKYVQRQMSPIRDRVNELDELTAKNSKDIKDVDARAQEGIRIASAKANEADQHALDAGNRAQQANTTATQASQHLQTVQTTVENIDQYKEASNIEIRFRPGQSVLSKKAKESLDDMSKGLADQKGYIVEVQGFAPGHGRVAVENSQRIADEVVRYLVINSNVPVYRIYTMGMGNAKVQATSATADSKPKYTKGGRVEISLLQNSLGQMASASTMPQSDANSTAAPAAPAQQSAPQQPATPQQ